MRSVRSAAAALAVLCLGSSVATAAQAEGPRALSPWDAQLYAAAFDATRRGDFAEAEAKAAQVSDRSLLGQLEFQKLFHPSAYRATYEELTSWLGRYGDLPNASRVWSLALRRKPEGAPDPAPPPALTRSRSWAEVAAAAGPAAASVANPKAAREALNAGDLATAYALAVANGEHWVAGLAAYRQGNYDAAFRAFEQVALDVTEDPWVRSGAGYWTARSALAKGSPDDALPYLRIAARYPHTFYGQIATRQLGFDVELIGSGPRPYEQAQAVVTPASTGAGLTDADVAAFIQSDARARRAVALAQIGQKADAGLELRAGLQAASGDEERARWTKLALALSPILSGPEKRYIDVSDYDSPILEPAGGFSVERALVYALVRKESRFEPTALSSVGAYGLMQVMPATAAMTAGDDKFASDPRRLHDPAVNLRVGQDYIARLQSIGLIEGDLLRTVAAYNSGPAPVMQAVRNLPADADALLIIESIPVPQTRQYVEEVMASYWIYQRIFGGETRSLDAVASGARVVTAQMDRRPQDAQGAGATLLAAATP